MQNTRFWSIFLHGRRALPPTFHDLVTFSSPLTSQRIRKSKPSVANCTSSVSPKLIGSAIAIHKTHKKKEGVIIITHNFFVLVVKL